MAAAQIGFLVLFPLVCSSWGIVASLIARSKWSVHAKFACCALLLLPLLRVNAFEPILFLATQAIVIVTWMSFRGRGETATSEAPSPRQFSLIGLLAMTVLAAAFFTVIAHTKIEAIWIWLGLFFGAIACGSATLLAVWLSMPGWRWWRLPVSMVALLLLTFPVAGWDAMLLNFPEWNRANTFLPFLEANSRWEQIAAYATAWFAGLTSVTLLNACFLLLWKRVGVEAYRVWAWGGCILLLTLLLVPQIYIYTHMTSELLHREELRENGYDQLLAAGNLYQASFGVEEAFDATAGQIRAALAENKEALELVREGLSLPVVVRNESLPLVELPSRSYMIRTHARLFQAEAVLALRGKRYDDAIDSIAEIFQLAHTMDDCNGLFALVSRAAESYALNLVSLLRPKVSVDQADRLVTLLTEVDQSATPLRDVVAADRDWSERQFGWRAQLYAVLERILGGGELQQALKHSFDRTSTFRRLLAADLAVRSYRARHGVLPDALDDTSLTAAMAIDPHAPNSDALQFRISDSTYTLFSVGANRVDDGGQIVGSGYGMEGGDIVLEKVFPEPLQ